MKIKIKGINDVKKEFDLYLKETKKTAEQFVEEKSGLTAKYMFLASIPFGSTKKKIQQSGESYINNDLKKTYASFSNMYAMIKKKDPDSAKAFWFHVKKEEWSKAQDIINKQGMEAHINLLASAKTHTYYPYNSGPLKVVTSQKQIHNIQDIFYKTIGMGKIGWLLVHRELTRIETKLPKWINNIIIEPTINKRWKNGEYIVTFKNNCKFASSVLKAASVNELANRAGNNIIKKWQRAQNAIAKKINKK